MFATHGTKGHFKSRIDNTVHDFPEPCKTDACMSISDDYSPPDYTDFNMKCQEKVLIRIKCLKM